MNNKEILKQYKTFREVNNKATKTIKGDIGTLKLLLRFTNNKPFDKITETDMIDFFKTIKSLGTKTIYGMRIMGFYKWLWKLEKHQRPANMKWFEFPSAELKAKNGEPDVKKYLIIDEEYGKIQHYCRYEPRWAALYETLYLSGGRPDEIMQMKIKDVTIDNENKVTITLRKSKTIPRNVPLPDKANYLIRWMDEHPYKDNPEAALFPTMCHRLRGKHMTTTSVNLHFIGIRNETGIKQTLSPKSFRKTRATLMFSARGKDGGILFDDTEMGKFFGWKPWTVAQRREQYDLRNFEDLKNKIQGNIQPTETNELLRHERDTLIKQQETKINKLEKTIKGFQLAQKLLQEELSRLDPSFKEALEQAKKQGYPL